MKQKIEKEIKDLQFALKNNWISVNDYCSMYLALSKKLKSLA
jgi:hypothetical protein